MKEWAPLVGKTKQPKSDKFYSDDEEDEKEEEGSDSSGSEGSSSSEGQQRHTWDINGVKSALFLVSKSMCVQSRAAKVKREAAKSRRRPRLILERVRADLSGAPVNPKGPKRRS